MNAIDFIREEHDRIDGLFLQAHEMDNRAEKRAMFHEIEQELDRHAHREEAILFPAFLSIEEIKDHVEAAYQEHQEIKLWLYKMSHARDDEEFDSQFDELGEMIVRHIEETEEMLFPRVEEALSQGELDSLGRQLARERDSEFKLAA